MKISIEIKNEFGYIDEFKIERSYLARFVDPEQEYPVTYTIKSDGSRLNEPCYIKGADLTENQIAELFYKRLL